MTRAANLAELTSSTPIRYGVSVCIRKAGKILLVKRGKHPYKGLWSFPGGTQEPGETPEEAIVREALEETGLALKSFARLGSVDINTGGGAEADRGMFHLTVFLCDEFEGTPSAGDDAREIGWFSKAEIPGIETVPQLGEALEKIGSMKN